MAGPQVNWKQNEAGTFNLPNSCFTPGLTSFLHPSLSHVVDALCSDDWSRQLTRLVLKQANRERSVRGDFHTTGLSSELAFPEIEMSVFRAGYLGRAARIFREMPEAHELLRMIGPEATQIAADAAWPFLIYRMEDLSLAFYLVETQCNQGIIVDERDQQRLTVLLAAFLRQAGRPVSAEDAGTRVSDYVKAYSLPDATTKQIAARPIRIDHPLLTELFSFDDELKGRGEDDCGLGRVGLFLCDPVQNDFRCDWCTPLNCHVFAATGSDGVHYSFLAADDDVKEESPVVATWPADGGESFIVAASLHEFLAKGLLSGFSELSDAPTGEPEVLEILDQLRKRFGLEPRPAHDQWNELQDRFRNQLRLPPQVR